MTLGGSASASSARPGDGQGRAASQSRRGHAASTRLTGVVAFTRRPAHPVERRTPCRLRTVPPRAPTQTHLLERRLRLTWASIPAEIASVAPEPSAGVGAGRPGRPLPGASRPDQARVVLSVRVGSRARRIPVAGGYVKRGVVLSRLHPLIHRTTSDRTVLLVLVVPPAFTESQGAEAPLASSTPGTRTRRPPSSSKSRIIRRSTPRTTGTTTASPGGDRTRCRRLSGRARGTGFPGGPSHSRPRSHGAGGTVPATYSCIGTSPFAQAAMTGSTMRQDSSASSPRMKSIGSLCSIASTRFA
jgi:hypothetical protein